EFAANHGLHTKPVLKLRARSGSSSRLPPVVMEICGLACWKPGGTPRVRQLDSTDGSRNGSEHGSISCASKRLSEPYSSPIEGARNPSAYVARSRKSSLTCQRSPYLGVNSPPKVE